MTNKRLIKKISFILALSVIVFAAIDTYLFLCHDINIMHITTPVILGLVVAIILCGLLHKFFYKWLTENLINFSFGEQDSPVEETEKITESICIVETPPIEQPIDLPIQKMLCCGILLMFSLLQRLKICWGTNWGRNFAGQKKKRANIESLFIPYRRFRFPKI